MSIQKTLTAAKVIETLENYIRSDDWQLESDPDVSIAGSSGMEYT